MSLISRRFKSVLKPAADTKPWFDGVVLVIFGSWFFAPIIVWLVRKPDPNAYKCGGPGFADFGCTGGTDAVIANTGAAIFMCFLFLAFFVAFIRLVNRWRGRKHG